MLIMYVVEGMVVLGIFDVILYSLLV